MKVSIAFLLVLLAVAAVGDLFAPYRAEAVQVTVVRDVSRVSGGGDVPIWPIRLSQASRHVVQVSHSGSHTVVSGHLLVNGEGGPLFAKVTGKYGPTPIGPDQKYCAKSLKRYAWECRIPFRLGRGEVIQLAAAGSGATLHLVTPVVVRADAAVPIGVGGLFVLFGVLSVIGLVFGLLRTTADLRLDCLAWVGAAWLVISAGWGGVALLVLMYAVFRSVRLQLTSFESTARLLATIALSVGALLGARLFLDSAALPFANPGGFDLGIPLGFAFVAIRVIDVALRVSTREIRSLSFRDFIRYMLFPATLAAGPVMTLPQLRASGAPAVTLIDWSAGLARVLVGLGKKLAADLVLVRVASPHSLSLLSGTDSAAVSSVWILLAATAVYVYLDFSGYSDIAIGTGRQLGFRIPENFANPFARQTMRSFWQAWHITLSNWVARWVHTFVAFPLRTAPTVARHSLPVLLSLITIGLWHELQITWVLWGLHHAAGILLGDAAGRLLEATKWMPGSALRWLGRALGAVWVWGWVALSHSFTLISDPLIAAKVWLHALTFGLAP